MNVIRFRCPGKEFEISSTALSVSLVASVYAEKDERGDETVKMPGKAELEIQEQKIKERTATRNREIKVEWKIEIEGNDNCYRSERKTTFIRREPRAFRLTKKKEEKENEKKKRKNREETDYGQRRKGQRGDYNIEIIQKADERRFKEKKRKVRGVGVEWPRKLLARMGVSGAAFGKR